MRIWLLAIGAAGLLACLGLPLLPLALAAPAAASGPRTFYVAPDGDDSRSGRSADAPLGSIQRALDQAQPGDRVELAPGDYFQDVVSRRGGEPGAPITIAGPPEAVVRGGGADRVIEITHDHITLEGFSLDGLHGDPKKRKGYRSKLLYVIGTAPGDGVTGLRVLHMRFANAGGECLRLRYFASNNEVAHSSFTSCGVYDFRFGGDKNGEAIYIGTARSQIDDGKNPTEELDRSSRNWIHHNTFDTRGNECVDIKEGATENLVEHNSCTGQRDPKSAGLGAQGERNVLRYNRVYGNEGAGVRLGGDKKDDGVGNAVYGNTLVDNEGGGIKIVRAPQGLICGNEIADNGDDAIVGKADGVGDPSAPCPEQ